MTTDKQCGENKTDVMISGIFNAFVDSVLVVVLPGHPGALHGELDVWFAALKPGCTPATIPSRILG